MTHKFDILRIEADGPRLLETATDLESARARIRELNKLNKTNLRRYGIFNQLTQMIILIDPESGPAN
jgi:hypothetical protein